MTPPSRAHALLILLASPLLAISACGEIIASGTLPSTQAQQSGPADLAVGARIPTLQLQNGRNYRNVIVTRIDDEGVSIQHEGGLARVKFDQFPGEFQAAAKSLQQVVAASPPRFGTDTLALFSAVSSQYWHNGEPVKGIADPKPVLTRLANSTDPLLKEAVKIALALDENQKTQESLGRALQAKMNGMVAGVRGEILGQGIDAATAPWHVTGLTPDGQPIYEQESTDLGAVAQGLEGSIDAANTQASMNRMSELGVEMFTLSRDLRGKLAELARRDLPKGPILSSPVVVEFVMPGFLRITNRSGKTLRHCLFSTATTMHCPKDQSGHQAIADFAGAFLGISEEFRRESARQTALQARLAGAQRGFVAFAPVIRDQETICIPFCDMPSLRAAAEVRLSLWTDEFTGVDAPVAGLRALKDELEAEARARWDRERANTGRDGNSPLNNSRRVNLKPKIPRNPNNPLHQGNGKRLFDR